VTDRQLRDIANARWQGKTDEALRMFKELVRDPDASAAVHLAYGYLLDSLSREARAIAHYTKALTSDCRHPTV
jgi:tetratricopeptide (TPR) repeat protein